MAIRDPSGYGLKQAKHNPRPDKSDKKNPSGQLAAPNGFFSVFIY
jgi:hypothetical protein